jgi:hypothetical protein
MNFVFLFLAHLSKPYRASQKREEEEEGGGGEGGRGRGKIWTDCNTFSLPCVPII